MKKKFFDEGFMGNIGTDGKHLYSIIYKFDGWDGSIQEYGNTEEEAIRNATAKGKIDDEDEIVKIVDLGEQHPEYTSESRDSFYGIPGAKDVGWAIIYQGCKIEPDAFWGDLGEQYDEEHPEDTNHEGFDQWCWDNKEILQAALDEYTKNVDDIDDFGNPVEEGIRKELVPQNGRQSFGHKAAEEEDEDGFTLFSYNTPVARLEKSDDGSHLDFILLNDYLSGTTMNHIHSFLISHKQDDIPAKKLKMMQVGDRVPLMAAESRKLVKEGAGAGYTVHIKNLKFGSILEKKYVKMEKDYESYWECQVEIMPGEYEIAAEDYYNDFFWQEHEFGETPTAQIDGGIATISYSTNSYDEDEAEDELRHEVARRTMDICFDYGGGWSHADLSRDKIEADRVEVENSEFYGSIDKIELNAPDLADAVNCGFQSIFDRGEDKEDEELEDEEPVNEVSGWKLEDEDLTLVNSESDGDKLYIVKLWWGSGYVMDCYNAYAFSDEEALNYVVAYIEKTDPKSLETTDEQAYEFLQDLVKDGEAEDMGEAEMHPYFQERFQYVDATREGASGAHYIYYENLVVAEYPKDHDYPMSKGVNRANESYVPKGDDGRKRVMDALEEFRQVMWDDTKVDDEEDHDLRRAWFDRTDKAISNAVQTYFKYTRI